ncbi:unnamed protein product [Choristocarpus tenellus]
MMGVAPLNQYPSHTHRILLARTGRLVMRRDISWESMWDSNLHDDTRHQSSGLPLWRGEEFFPVITSGEITPGDSSDKETGIFWRIWLKTLMWGNTWGQGMQKKSNWNLG